MKKGNFSKFAMILLLGLLTHALAQIFEFGTITIVDIERCYLCAVGVENINYLVKTIDLYNIGQSMLLHHFLNLGCENCKMLDLKELNVVERRHLPQILDGGANVFHSL